MVYSSSITKLGFSRRTNLLLLVAGFGLGQGSLFVSQTWLIWNGDLALLGLFGFHLMLLVLVSQIVDWGGLVILARTALLDDEGLYGWDEVLANYWALCVVRIFVAIVFIIAAIIYLIYTNDGFSFFYILLSILSLIVWAFNLSGLLDGLRLSGLAGLAIPIPYLVSAVALDYSSSLTRNNAGALLGMAFLLGIVLAVVTQWIVILRKGVSMRIIWPSEELVKNMAKEGALYLAAFLPGQVLLRAQVVLSNIILGIEVSGLFIYGKQIINMVNQMVAFVRRVEFPRLVNELEVAKGGYIFLLSKIQLHGLLLGVISGLILWIAPLLVHPIIPYSFIEASRTVSMLAPVLISGVIFSVLNQGLIGMGAFPSAAIATNLVTVVAISLSWPLAYMIGIKGFTLAEVGGHIMGIILASIMYRKM